MLTTVGPYLLERLIGRGGTSDVYVGRRTSGDLAAVKIRTAPVTDAARGRFAREVSAQERVSHHASVVTLIAASSPADDVLWLAQELYAGSLDTRLRRFGILGHDAGRRVAFALLSALSECHAQGLVHRDVVPGNILLGSGGQVALGDFGTASRRPGPGEDPAEGTAPYVAPELFSGYLPWPGSDLYSAARTIVVACGGRVPGVISSALAVAMHPDPARRTLGVDELRELVRSRWR